MIAERTDGFWKGALAEGKTYCLRTATNDYFFTPAEYKKLALNMLSLLAEEDIRLGRFLTSKIYTGQEENNDE